MIYGYTLLTDFAAMNHRKNAWSFIAAYEISFDNIALMPIDLWWVRRLGVEIQRLLERLFRAGKSLVQYQIHSGPKAARVHWSVEKGEQALMER